MPNTSLKISRQEDTLIQAIEMALHEFGVAAPPETGLPRDLRIVEWRRVLGAYDRLTFGDVDPGEETSEGRKKRLDARRKELKLVGELLFRKGLASKDGAMIWLTGKHRWTANREDQTISIALPQLFQIECLLLELVNRMDRLERSTLRPTKKTPSLAEEYKKEAARFYAMSKVAENPEAGEEYKKQAARFYALSKEAEEADAQDGISADPDEFLNF